MPIAPAVPFGGLAGLRFLDRTHERQFATFAASPDLAREVSYFREHAGQVRDLEQLMGDRRLLAVVLGAFGLDDDIDKGAFVRKVLAEGTLDRNAFAARLVEPAYREMSAALGFGDAGGMLVVESVREDIVARYKARRYELGVGEQDIDLRLAMNFRREAAKIASAGGADRTIWLRLLGSEPLRAVVERALGLPAAFAALDLDRQLAVLDERAPRLLGSAGPAALSDPVTRDAFVERFLLNAQLAQTAAVPAARGSVALSLLTGSQVGSGASSALFASNFT